MPRAIGDTAKVPLCSPPAGMRISRSTFSLDSLVWNSSSETPRIPSKGILSTEEFPFGDPIVTAGDPMYLAYLDKAALDSYKTRLYQGEKPENLENLAEREIRLIVVRLKDRESAKQLWTRLLSSVTPTVTCLEPVELDSVSYCELTIADRAACFWIQNLWFTYIDVPVRAAGGSLELAGTIRDRVRKQVVQRYASEAR
ncbi:MAG: hypothetical protein WDA75_19295 [Candidatus Latescibacterota bacterium]